MIKKQQGKKQYRKVNMCQESSSESDSDFECVKIVRLENTVNAANTHESFY